jgi:hypothetical protein
MKKTKKVKTNTTSVLKAETGHQLVFKTAGAVTIKYSVYIVTENDRHAFHLAGLHSPAEALWLSLGEYLSNSHSQAAITEVLVIGYSQTKKEREQGIAHAYLHFPPLPTY